MKLQNSLASLQTRASDSGLGGGGRGRGGMMTTLLCRPPQQHLQKSRCTRFLQYFRDVGPSHIVTICTLDFANSTFGFARAFGENSKLVWGKLVFYAVFKVLWSCRSPLLTTVL